MPFSQAVDAKPGSGIGLCHCRELVEELGGTIGVDSVCGSGSKFFVTLPFQAVEASGVVIEMRKSAAQQPAEKAARSMSVHVLIVDDNLGLAALTVLMLAQAGMTSECIDNVETALACWRKATSRCFSSTKGCSVVPALIWSLKSEVRATAFP